MSLPLVSVIVPNYNYGRSIGLCVEAALAQTYPNIEVVVVDDCSTDDSAAIAAAAGARVVSTGVNSGVAVARNLGAELSSGEILVFLDSDVAMHPDAVAKSVELLASGQGYGAICGTYEPEPLIRDSLIEEYRSLQQYYLLLKSEGSSTPSTPRSWPCPGGSSTRWGRSTRSCGTPRTRTTGGGSPSGTRC